MKACGDRQVERMTGLGPPDIEGPRAIVIGVVDVSRAYAAGLARDTEAHLDLEMCGGRRLVDLTVEVDAAVLRTEAQANLSSTTHSRRHSTRATIPGCCPR
jgi:hypothetical protein